MINRLRIQLVPSNERNIGYEQKFEEGVTEGAGRTVTSIEENGNIVISYDVKMDEENNIHFTDVQKNNLVNHEVIESLYLDCEKKRRIFSLGPEYLEEVYFSLTLDQGNGDNLQKYRKFRNSLEKFYESVKGELVACSKIDDNTRMYKIKIPRDNEFCK